MAAPRNRTSASPHHGRGSGTALAALRRLRSIHLAVLIMVGVQVPALLALILRVPGGLGWLALPLAGALSYSLYLSAASPYALRPRSQLHLYLGIWPALAWWAACAAFIPLAPLALLVGWPLRVPTQLALAGVGVLCVVAGIRAIWPVPQVRRITLHFPELPPAFDGYRIAQISDLHCGPFASEERIRGWVRRINALRPELVAVTGDLIASGADHVASVARALAALRATDGAFVVMGNHDYFGAGETLVSALEAAGLRLLRNAALPISRGEQRLLLVGVDDSWTHRANLRQALAAQPRAALPFSVLLAHDPDIFPEAAAGGIALTLSGHTHGGQLAIPFLSRRFNLARLITRFSSGLYREGSSLLYVNRGAGTTGPPIRIGARAEIALFTLRRGPAGAAS